MIVIENTRFGTVEIDESSVLTFGNGLVGFPEQTSFVLLERDEGKMVAYLQSLKTPMLAFPVIDAAEVNDYPKPTPAVLAKTAGLPDGEFAVLVIVAVDQSASTLEANLLAPLIIEMASHRCAQVVLDARRYSAAHSLAPPADPKLDAVAEAKARIAQIRRDAEQRATAAMPR